MKFPFLQTMCVVLICVAPFSAQAFEVSPLTIACDGAAPISYQVELAQTHDQRRQGLMYRTDLPARTGMLFNFEQDQAVTMWMRNTYVALDMLFVARDGTIVHIHPDAVPLDETYIRSGRPVRGVLEVPAGTARADGVQIGCVIHHPIFLNHTNH